MHTRTLISAPSMMRPRLMIVCDLGEGFYALGREEQRRRLDARLEEARERLLTHLEGTPTDDGARLSA